MAVIIIIIIISYMLYKLGFARYFLRLCEIPEARKAPTPHQEHDEISDRERLELRAAYIIKREGSDPVTVKYMSDELLQAVIREYIKAN